MANKTTKATSTKVATTAEAADTNSALGVGTAKHASVLIPAIRVGVRHVDVQAECNSVQDAYRTSVTISYNYETRMKAVTFGSYGEQIEINSHERIRISDDYIKETFTIDTEIDMTNFHIIVTMINGEKVTVTVQ